MPLILAIDQDRHQSAQLASLVRGRLDVDLVQAASAGEALLALNERIPDLILTSPLLSPFDDGVLDEYLRDLGPAGAHVQTLRIPVLSQTSKKSRAQARGFSLLRRRKNTAPEACAPSMFADEIGHYLARAAEERLASSERLPTQVEPARHEVVALTNTRETSPNRTVTDSFPVYAEPEPFAIYTESDPTPIYTGSDTTPIYTPPDAPVYANSPAFRSEPEPLVEHEPLRGVVETARAVYDDLIRAVEHDEQPEPVGGPGEGTTGSVIFPGAAPPSVYETLEQVAARAEHAEVPRNDIAPEPSVAAADPEPAVVIVAPGPVFVVVPEPIVVVPQPVVVAPEPAVVVPEPVVFATEPAVVVPEPVVFVAPEPVVVVPEPAVVTPEPIAAMVAGAPVQEAAPPPAGEPAPLVVRVEAQTGREPAIEATTLAPISAPEPMATKELWFKPNTYLGRLERKLPVVTTEPIAALVTEALVKEAAPPPAGEPVVPPVVRAEARTGPEPTATKEFWFKPNTYLGRLERERARRKGLISSDAPAQVEAPVGVEPQARVEPPTSVEATVSVETPVRVEASIEAVAPATIEAAVSVESTPLEPEAALPDEIMPVIAEVPVAAAKPVEVAEEVISAEPPVVTGHVEAAPQRTESFNAALAAIKAAWDAGPRQKAAPPAETTAVVEPEPSLEPKPSPEPVLAAVPRPQPEPQPAVVAASVNSGFEIDLTEFVDALDEPAPVAAVVAPEPPKEAPAAIVAPLVDVPAEAPAEPGEVYEISVGPGEVGELESALQSPGTTPQKRRRSKPVERVKPAKKAAGKKSARQPDLKDRPVQDEWGMFDPNQCGFAALIEKLEEETEGKDEKQTRYKTTVRVISSG